MMKFFIFSITMSYLFLSNNYLMAQETFKISGTIEHLSPPNYVILVTNDGRALTLDTTKVINGKFTFNGIVDEPSKGFLYLSHSPKINFQSSKNDMIPIFLEKGNITIQSKDSLKNAKLGGTLSNVQYQEFLNLVKPIDDSLAILNHGLMLSKSGGDSLKANQLTRYYKSITDNKENAILNFIKANNKSFVSLSLIREYFNPYSEYEKSLAAFKLLDPSTRESTITGKMLAHILNLTSNFGVGSIAPDFTAKSISGQSITLSSYRGKYVLVDFWASWCGPCREESPNLIKAYKGLQNKDFTILGFSLDQGTDGKEKWKKAIEMDGITWTQVSDLQGLGSVIASKYYVAAIPANFLIDPNGKIIAQDLRGPDLEENLKKLILKN